VRFPHTGYWTKAQGNNDGSVQTATTREGKGVKFRCQLTPETSAGSYERTGLELSNPFLLLCKIDPGEKFQPGDDFTFDNYPGKRFRCSIAKPLKWDAIRRISFMQITLELLDHTPA